MKFDVKNVEINGAFYEMFERVFKEDFFQILTGMRPSPKIKRLSAMPKEYKLSEEEEEMMTEWRVKQGATMRKYTGRIAYIGTKLHKKEYNGSYEDYMSFLAAEDASVFLNPEVSSEIWKKINLDQKTPESVKNA